MTPSSVLPPKPLSVRGVAHVLGVSMKTVRRMLHANELPGAHLVRGMWRIPRQALDAVRKYPTLTRAGHSK